MEYDLLLIWKIVKLLDRNRCYKIVPLVTENKGELVGVVSGQKVG